MPLRNQIKALIKFKQSVTSFKCIRKAKDLINLLFCFYTNKGFRHKYITSSNINRTHQENYKSHITNNLNTDNVNHHLIINPIKHVKRISVNINKNITKFSNRPNKQSLDNFNMYQPFKFNNNLNTYYSMLVKLSKENFLKKTSNKDFMNDLPKQQIIIKRSDKNINIPVKMITDYEINNKNDVIKSYDIDHNNVKHFLKNNKFKRKISSEKTKTYIKRYNCLHFHCIPLVNKIWSIKGFKQNINVNRHRFSHTEAAEPFECPICNITFASNDLLNRHMIISHAFSKRDTFVDNFRNVFKKKDKKENEENTENDDDENKNIGEKESIEKDITENKESTENTESTKNNGDVGEDS